MDSLVVPARGSRGVSGWRLATAGCLASLLLAACSSGHAQNVGAGPGPITGLGGPQAQIGSSPAVAGANGLAAGGHQSAKAPAGANGVKGKSNPAARPGIQPAAAKRLTGLNAQSVQLLVSQLPKPSVRSGPNISYSEAIFTGASIFGDLGSAAWNISHQDADGKLRTWGSALYVSSTSSNAVAALRHSPAVAHYCPRGRTSLPGFSRAGTVTIAVVCADVNSPGNWWTVVERADRLTYLVLATSDSSRSETVATGTAVFQALTAMTPRINIKLAVFKRSS